MVAARTPLIAAAVKKRDVDTVCSAIMFPAEMRLSNIDSWRGEGRDRGDADKVVRVRVESVERCGALVDWAFSRVSVTSLKNVTVLRDDDEIVVQPAAGAQIFGKLLGVVNQ